MYDVDLARYTILTTGVHKSGVTRGIICDPKILQAYVFSVCMRCFLNTFKLKRDAFPYFFF